MKNLFNQARAEKLKTEGMQKAADNVSEYLELGRQEAKNLARIQGKVTADDVMWALNLDYGIDSLGPAAGSLFKGKEWEFTGEWIKSKRTTNHSRMIRVWRLKW